MNSRTRGLSHAEGNGAPVINIWRDRLQRSKASDFNNVISRLLPLCERHSAEHEWLGKLAQETDPELQSNSLLFIARHFAHSGELTKADAAYQALLAIASATEYAKIASAERGALQSGGNFSFNLENHLRTFTKEICRLDVLIGMSVGQAAFSGTRAFLQARWLAAPVRTWYNHGRLAKALASSAAFFVEVPVFVGASRVLQKWGDARPSPSSLGQNLLEMGVSLFALRSMRSLGQVSMAAIRKGSQVSPGFAAGLFPQAAMFGGILAGQSMLNVLNDRPISTPQSLLQSLASLLQFQVAARFAPRFGADWELRARQAASGSPRQGTFENLLGWRPSSVTASVNAPQPPSALANWSLSSISEGVPGTSLDTFSRKRIPFFSDPGEYQHWRNSFGALESDASILLMNRVNSPLWLHSAVGLAARNFQLIERFRAELKDPQLHRSLIKTQDALRLIHDDMSRLLGVDLSEVTREEWAALSGALARIPNMMVNFMQNSFPEEFDNVWDNAATARATALRILNRYHFNSDAWLPGQIDITSPQREVLIPTDGTYLRYGFTQGPPFHYDLKGENFRIRLLGNPPEIRLKLADKHRVEVVTEDRETRARLQIFAKQQQLIIQLRGDDLITESARIDLLEAYEIGDWEALNRADSKQWLQRHLLEHLRIGGIGYFVHSDFRMVERVAELLTMHRLGDVIWGALNANTLLPRNPDDSSRINFVHFRKIAE